MREPILPKTARASLSPKLRTARAVFLGTERPERKLSGADTIATTRTCVRSSVMWLAGIPVADKAVLQLAASLREAELVDTAETLERAYDREARIVALDIPDREGILRVLEEYPDELLQLRATLLQAHVWRQREGLS